MRNTGWFTSARIAGMLLLLGVLVLIGTVVYISAQDLLSGMEAAFRGVHPGSPDPSGLLIIGRTALFFQISQLAGFTLLTQHLRQNGDRGEAAIALVLLVNWSVVGLVESSFHANVTVWAAREAARTGATPVFYEPLRRWLNYELQYANMSFILTSMALFSWSALRTGQIARWAGWAALAWSLAAFPLYYSVFEAPAVFILTPFFLGTGLLARNEKRLLSERRNPAVLRL